jgi:mannose-6-phosphate isomerase
LLSDHRLHASRVASGALTGWTLRQLMEQRAADLLGGAAGRFPLLVKLLDAREDLSIQVHPDDTDALTWAPAEGGKTEAWLVLEADPGAAIYLGLKPGIDKPTIARELAAGTIALCLNRYEPLPGQCYFVPAGTVHALGGNLVVLEIQQTSDATFRLDDWGRLDAAGKPRPLHWDAGLACLKETPQGAGLQQPQRLTEDVERLVACDNFRLHRLTLHQEATVRTPGLLIGLEGLAALRYKQQDFPLRRGSLMLLPATLAEVQIKPQGTCVLVQAEFVRG